MKRIVFIVFAMIMLMSNVVFAQEELKDKKKSTQIDGITFITQGGTYYIDYRCLPSMFITVIENKKGFLKDRKTIYIGVDKGVYAIPTEVNVKKGDIEVTEDFYKENNIIKLILERKNDSKLAEFEVKFISDGFTRYKENEELPVYSAWVITGNKYKDNLFYSKEEEGKIILDNEFIKVANKLNEDSYDTENTVILKDEENFNIDKNKYIIIPLEILIMFLKI